MGISHLNHYIPHTGSLSLVVIHNATCILSTFKVPIVSQSQDFKNLKSKVSSETEDNL